ncbi:hypothetical protein IAQ61_010213 [Plenodomus lingam]|uniref:Lea domain protein n=1 Tax=Leptosphaeria maculans (strain JN3 / isolate v23.1.3 / race Av1-4-5-6-7-8) TaxID=985895 RepID=E5A395_LEPMJ|nr:hypothetical protein LEMA_P095170.1 [Plenodomus lingam JN3]KAH9862012.1 hypothetical protein IAQ61_010213 [Plenodomus lingam]CBX98108.1 hypothetical protein LEMA_P095170.1 [Plenodomus lingam JN3]
MFRQQIARQARLFSTTPVARKSPVETIKDAAKAVDRTISGAAVKGIEKGEEVAGAVKEAIPETKGEAKGQANEMAGAAKGKAAELKGEAKAKANELQGEANKKM